MVPDLTGCHDLVGKARLDRFEGEPAMLTLEDFEVGIGLCQCDELFLRMCSFSRSLRETVRMPEMHELAVSCTHGFPVSTIIQFEQSIIGCEIPCAGLVFVHDCKLTVV